MLKKTFTYEDFNGETKTEDFYFNISKVELMELETEYEGGFSAYIEEISKSEDSKSALEVFKKIVDLAIGKRSADGSKFIKNAEIKEDFKYSPAYDELFMEIMSDAKKAAAFIEGILPADLRDQAKKAAKEAKK